MKVTTQETLLFCHFKGYHRYVTLSGQSAPSPLKLGDHRALDFLNTIPMVDGALTETLTSDAAVLHWLTAMGFGKRAVEAGLPGDLQKAAIRLRKALRSAVEHRKAGEPIHWRYWNTLLARCPSHLAVIATNSEVYTERRWTSGTPEEALAPLIEEAVNLLLEGDFNLIRQCEDEHCVLWFYDRTKSHRRRWCSPQTCGNRNKVAAYRERQRTEA